MNDKIAKALRAAAGYQNQSATPGVMPFPGVARMYQHPVISYRVTTKTSYARLPGLTEWAKVKTRLRRMVHDHREQPVIMMKEGKPETQPVPVTKPARLDPKGAKGMYRALKRLARKKLLPTVGAAIIQAYQPKEQTA